MLLAYQALYTLNCIDPQVYQQFKGVALLVVQLRGRQSNYEWHHEDALFSYGHQQCVQLIKQVLFEYFMGMCASLDKHKKPTHYHDREPNDTPALKHKNLPKLEFHALLANIKLKKYPYRKAIPTFYIGSANSFTLPERKKENEQTLKWVIYQKYDFVMTEYELRKNFLKVQIVNEDNLVVGDIIINLFLIATGPFHQDFAVSYKNDKIGRVIFDLKLSQIIELKIQSELAEVFLIKKHPGEEFSFTIKTIVGYNGSTSQSEPSYPAIVLLENKSSEMISSADQINDLQMGMKKRRKSQKTNIKQIGMGQNLMWNKKGGILPGLTTKVIASELYNIYFQILIWKHSRIDQVTQKEFFADCYVSFCKLFGTEATIISHGIDQYQSRKISMTEKIEHYGKDYGKAKFEFRIANQPYFKQYQVCVHTEVGILKTSPIFGVQETETSDKCPQLKEILLKSQSVEQNVISLNKLEHEGSNQQIKSKKHDIAEQLSNIFDILQKPSLYVHEQFLFQYSSEKWLLKGQKILVQLGMKITEYIEIEDPDINDICWVILISLIKRGQFNLNHIGFNEKQKKQILSNQLDTYLQKKQKVAVMYKLFLYKLLELTLSSLNRKCSEYQRTFAEVFTAYAYFRVPELRKEILRLITNEKDPQINEWKGIEFNLHDDLSERKIKSNTNIFSEIFDWEQHFYQCILKDEQIENENVTIHDILSHAAWKERFAKRGLAFFYFLKYWVIYIENNLQQKKDIPWRQFPGYNRLLKGFFVEMKIRTILHYPDALIEAGLKLLRNEKIINPFMKILLSKTNIYDTSAVIRVLEYLILIFNSLKANSRSLPISFNYSYFFKALKIIFQSQFSLGISSAITLIYTHFSLFHIQFRKSISMYFMGKIFWKLFLNWSFTVRNVFYYLITYKIYGQAHYLSDSATKSNFSISHNDILARFDQLIQILNKESTNYFLVKTRLYTDYHDKELYKKMKLKANYKLKKRSEEQKRVIMQRQKEGVSVRMGSENSGDMEYTLRTEIKSKQNMVLESVRKNERSYSSQVYINAKVHMNNKKNSNRKSFFTNHQTLLQTTQEIDNHSILIQRIIHEKQFLIPDIEQEKIKYIPLFFPKFKEIQSKFIKGLEKQDRSCPEIKYEISIDNREIRPDKIDDW